MNKAQAGCWIGHVTLPFRLLPLERRVAVASCSSTVIRSPFVLLRHVRAALLELELRKTSDKDLSSLLPPRRFSPARLSRATSLGFLGLEPLARPRAVALITQCASIPHFWTEQASDKGEFVVCEPDEGRYALFMHELGQDALRSRVKRVESAADAAKHAATLVSSYPTSSAVQAAYLLPPGSVLAALKGASHPQPAHFPAGLETLCLDFSTHDLEPARSVARQLRLQTDARAVVCDVAALGSSNVGGELYVGGEARVAEAAGTLLSLLGGKVTHAGPSGAGLSLKLVSE